MPSRGTRSGRQRGSRPQVWRNHLGSLYVRSLKGGPGEVAGWGLSCQSLFRECTCPIVMLVFGLFTVWSSYSKSQSKKSALLNPKEMICVLRFPLKTCILSCRVPEGRGLQKTTRPPGCDETQSVNPLVSTQVDKQTIKTKKMGQYETYFNWGRVSLARHSILNA